MVYCPSRMWELFPKPVQSTESIWHASWTQICMLSFVVLMSFHNKFYWAVSCYWPTYMAYNRCGVAEKFEYTTLENMPLKSHEEQTNSTMLLPFTWIMRLLLHRWSSLILNFFNKQSGQIVGNYQYTNQSVDV